METLDIAQDQTFTQFARRVLEHEAQALLAIKTRIPEDFSTLCKAILETRGHVIVMGMGKSGHIGRKIAATLSSTGTPSFFVHPAEASHGDMGMITPEDIVMLLSYSGSTDEIVSLLPFIRRLNTPIVSITGNPHSPLAQNANYHININVTQEACPLDLAPTASTTAMLAMGDAIALTLLKARGFTKEDFARSHPAGALGRKLVKIKDLMLTGNALPKVSLEATISDAIIEMSQKGLGMTAIINSNHQLEGLFTDGDLRRTIAKEIDIHKEKVANFMTKNCKTLSEEALAVDAIASMEKNKVNGFLVVDNNNQLVGALNMHNLLQARVF